LPDTTIEKPGPCGASFLGAGDSDDCTWFDRLEGFSDARGKGDDRLDAVVSSDDDNESKAEGRQILLMLDPTVAGDEDIEDRRGAAKELSVLKARPTLACDRSDLVLAKVCGELTRYGLIEENAHRPS
jgi:hypothetical protein